MNLTSLLTSFSNLLTNLVSYLVVNLTNFISKFEKGKKLVNIMDCLDEIIMH